MAFLCRLPVEKFRIARIYELSSKTELPLRLSYLNYLFEFALDPECGKNALPSYLSSKIRCDEYFEQAIITISNLSQTPATNVLLYLEQKMHLSSVIARGGDKVEPVKDVEDIREVIPSMDLIRNCSADVSGLSEKLQKYGKTVNVKFKSHLYKDFMTQMNGLQKTDEYINNQFGKFSLNNSAVAVKFDSYR